MKLNINEIVRVCLTAKGAESYNTWLGSEDLTQGEVLSIQMWELMQCFGQYPHLGMSGTLFENNEIEIIALGKEPKE